MGCAGHSFVQTPHLDALAARGTRFTNAYTPSPICVPARASLATGRPVHEIGYWDNAMAYDGRVPGWAHALQTRGVPVHSIGKLHYRDAQDPVGFDEMHLPMMVLGGHGMVWASIRRDGDRIQSRSKMLGEQIGPGHSSYTQYDAAVTNSAVSWLEARAASNDDRPWCLFVGLVAPHFPLQAPPEFYDLYPEGSLPEPKLLPQNGYRRHPWIEAQNWMSDSEAAFEDADERNRAFSAYYGLCSWLDHNVGQILSALDSNCLSEDTTVIYTSDHGDNVGARGLWGKSNMYEESAAIPLMMAGPGIQQGFCDTPVSLLDVAATAADHFDAPLDGPGLPLPQIADAPYDPDRVVFSEYHAAGAVSAAYMIRKGRWKYIHYVGFAPELFDLEDDPEELTDLGRNPAYADVRDGLEAALREICDPEAVNAQAFAAQDAMIDAFGGREAALTIGAPGATPAPETGGDG